MTKTFVKKRKEKKNSQGKDPRTFRDPVERWRVQEKQKKRSERRGRKKKVKKKKVKCRRKSLWTKCKERIASLFVAGERRRCRKERQEE